MTRAELAKLREEKKAADKRARARHDAQFAKLVQKRKDKLKAKLTRVKDEKRAWSSHCKEQAAVGRIMAKNMPIVSEIKKQLWRELGLLAEEKQI